MGKKKNPRLIVVNKRKRRSKSQFIASVILLGFFSLILFVNNSTQLLDKLNMIYNINYVIWFGIIGSVMYLIFRVASGDLN
jgi:hypothetical protein